LLINSNGVLGSGNVFLFSPEVSAFVSVGDAVPVQLEVSTKTAVNALGGTITFDPNILSVDSLTRSASIIDLWSEEPVISNTEGSIRWSGGIINADTKTSGAHGEIFTINFRAMKAGKLNLGLTNGELLANNGEGTNVLSGNSTLTLYVREQGYPSPDINDDGSFSIADINALYVKTFYAYDQKYDINNDGKVSWADVKTLISLI